MTIEVLVAQWLLIRRDNDKDRHKPKKLLMIIDIQHQYKYKLQTMLCLLKHFKIYPDFAKLPITFMMDYWGFKPCIFEHINIFKK